MNKNQQILLKSLRSALFDEELYNIDDTDLEEVVKEAWAQAVLGIVSPVLPIQNDRVEQGKARYMRMLYEQDQIVRLLDSNHIPVVVLKGYSAAIYYPRPYLRTMGDIDLLVPRNRFTDAMYVFDSNGYTYKFGKDSKGKLAVGARHIEYEKNGVEFELHHHFSSLGYDIDELLEESIKRREYRELNGFKFPMLPEIENGMVLLGHINQHLKDDSLGLRQIIDWEMYIYSVMNDQLWKDSFAPLAKQAGLYELAVSVTKMCIKYLGLPAEYCFDTTEDNKALGDLLEVILACGNFGRKAAMSAETNNERMVARVTRGIKSKGFFSFFCYIGVKKWAAARKFPILKPLAFFYGVWLVLSGGVKAVSKTGNIKEGIVKGRSREKLYKELGVKD